MKHMLRLTDFTPQELFRIFEMADEIGRGKHSDALHGKTVVMFFPDTSLRTRVTYEKGVHLLGGQPILFPGTTLDKKEDIRDVCGYLNQWADLVIVRHRDITLLERMGQALSCPLINAMTDVNHPCEVLSDLYALSKRRRSFLDDRYLFVGKRGNIGLAWKEAADVLGFHLAQCCPAGYEIEGLPVFHDLYNAVAGIDIICTDPVSEAEQADFAPLQITAAVMQAANPGALLNPCPPFYRGQEVSAEVIDSPFFVGYSFKKCLLEVQQAVMMYCLSTY